MLQCFRLLQFSILFVHFDCESKNNKNENIFLSFPADAPVCTSSVVMLVGASLEESVSVPCRVNADPPDVDFEWTFSSSGERFEVPHGHYTTLHDNNGNNNSRNNHGDSSRSTFVQPNEPHSESDGEFIVILFGVGEIEIHRKGSYL